jgi:thioredoxin 1
MALTLTQENFSEEVLKSDVPVLVDFWAPWCGPCKVQGPIVEELSAEYEGKPAKIAKVNVDENAALASQYGVMSIPTLMVFKGGQPVDQLVGLQQKDTLKERLEKAMA